MRRLLPFFALFGCDYGLDFDFTTEATSITVTAPGDGTTTVAICAGPSGLLSCNRDEQFSASIDGQTVEAGPTLFSFGMQYAELDTDEPDTLVTVTRIRDRAAGRVTLPERFDLEGPGPDDVISRSRNGIRLRWQPSGTDDPMHWDPTAYCDDGHHYADGDSESDDGEVIIEGTQLPKVPSSGCIGEVTLIREHEGTTDRAFAEGSRIVGQQERAVAFQLVP